LGKQKSAENEATTRLLPTERLTKRLVEGDKCIVPPGP
jgi:hypothetical protein